MSVISREEPSKRALMSLILGFGVRYSRILCDLWHIDVIFQWWYSEDVKMVLQRWSYENEVPSTICSVLYIVCVHMCVCIYVGKHFKITYESGYKPFIFSKSLINLSSKFQVEILFGFLHLSHHPVPFKGKKWKGRQKKERKNNQPNWM